MLVLSRKEQEQIRIGNDIVITIVRIKGGSVRIGVEAPQNVRVLRSELPNFGAEGESVEESTAPHAVASLRETKLVQGISGKQPLRNFVQNRIERSAPTAEGVFDPFRAGPTLVVAEAAL